jgi:hypothetical protein
LAEVERAGYERADRAALHEPARLKSRPVGGDLRPLGQKFGEYSPTRTYYGHAADKNAKRK